MNENDLVAVGGELTVESLKLAYSNGIFPWPQEGLPMLWFSPDPRGILDFSEFHIPMSLKKFARKNPQLKFTWDQAFAEVIEQCALQKRPGQSGTWILPEMKAAYVELHQEGLAHSLECWDGSQLVGGIYGVQIGGVFSGESMFYLKPNISKMCFWKLVDKLRAEGQQWMDIQMVTPVTEAFGGKYISRAEFKKKMGLAASGPVKNFDKK